MIVFGSGRSGLFRVSSAGGVPTAVTTLADGEDAHRWPHFLPDGRHFFYTAVTGALLPSGEAGHDQDWLARSGRACRGVASGRFIGKPTPPGTCCSPATQTLMAQAFDPDARQLTGDAIPVMTERVSTEGSRYVSASVSENGTLVYAPGGSPNPPQLMWFDRAGKILGTLGEGAADVNLSLSPDEQQVAVALRSGSPENLDIWTIDIARNLRNRVTIRRATRRMAGVVARWHTHRVRNGARGAEGPEKARLVQTLVNGTGANETLFEAVATPARPCGPRQCVLAPSDWSADGRFVLYTFSGSFPVTSDIWALPLFGDRKPFPVVQTEFSESLGVFSAGRSMDRLHDQRDRAAQRLRSAISSCWQEISDLAERRTQSALARRWQRVVLSRRGRGDDGGADRLDRCRRGRVAKDAFSGWCGQHQPGVRGDQGWTAVPRQHETAECCHRNAADRHRQLDLDAPEIT